MGRHTSDEPTRRTYTLLALGFVAFVVYGSLVPLRTQPLSWTEAVARFAVVCGQPVRVESLSDWMTNVLLFIPLAFLLLAAVCVDRPEGRSRIAALFVLPFCTALSAAIEFAQLWFPGRVSSLNDIVAETFGGLLGILAWYAVGRRVTAWARGMWAGLAGRGWAARLLPMYLLLLLLIETLPLDLTIRPAELYHKYRAGRVHLLPFTAGGEGLGALLTKQVWNVLYFLPIGVLLAHLRGKAGGPVGDWRRALLSGVLVAGGIEVAQFFVESRNCDATDVITGAMAVLAGWGAGRALPEVRIASRRPATVPLLLCSWLAALLFINWQPFDFTFDTADIGRRVVALSPVPFADYHRAPILHAFDQLLNKVIVWVPLGALLALRPGGARRALFLAATCAVGVEAGQLFLPSHCASVTDAILETAGAGLGLALVRRAQHVASSSDLLFVVPPLGGAEDRLKAELRTSDPWSLQSGTSLGITHGSSR